MVNPSNIVSVHIACKPRDCWVSRVAMSGKHVSVKVVENVCGEGESQNQLFRISAGDEVQKVSRLLKKEPSFKKLQVLYGREGHLFGYATASCRCCGLELAKNCIVRSVSSYKDGWVMWHVIGYSESIKNFINSLVKENITFKTLSQQTLSWNGVLTQRQELFLKTALEQGFFDHPRRITVRELASELGVAPATVSESLRKSIKKVVKEYISLMYGSEFQREE
ncbi:MAG: helix-turn-helix domain-containing protein [Candidatus Caldarchaeum sp.]|nr:helix-turn-helix domain-containing protein [Candidatus Caldarchaeum sp.]